MRSNSYKMWAYCDAASPWQYGFQDPATPIISGIIHLHNNIIFYLIVIAVLVLWLLARGIYLFNQNHNKVANKRFTHSTVLEIVWTLLPAFLLLLLAGPSFALLYSIDEVVYPQINVKVVGHQWYWSYEYGGVMHYVTEKPLLFDSYMLSEDDIVLGGLRLIEVDSRLRLPTNTHIRMLITSADVLHSWAVPSLGVKIDACPGRLNIVSLYIEREGIFYGQCSEICGVNHGFMPIVVESMNPKAYLHWVASMLSSSDTAYLTSAEILALEKGCSASNDYTALFDISERHRSFDYNAEPGLHTLGPRNHLNQAQYALSLNVDHSPIVNKKKA